MDLGKLNRDAEDRSVVWAAVVTAAIAMLALLNGALAVAAGARSSAIVLAVIGVLQMALAYGVYRRSRACAVAVFALWILDRVVVVLAYGLNVGIVVWTVVLTALLYAGMRATFAQRARFAVPPGRRSGAAA